MPPRSQRQQPPPTSSHDAPATNDNSTGTTRANPSTPSGQARHAGGVARLDTLARRGSSSPAPNSLKIKPKATVNRRSAQEREEAEREEQRRQEARNAAAANASGSGSNAGPSGEGKGGFFRGRGWQRGGRGGGWFGGRGGGYAMPYPERFGEGVASGPFGAGSIQSTAAGRKRFLPGGGSGSSRGDRVETTMSSSSRSGLKKKGDDNKDGGDVSMPDMQKLKHEFLYSSDEEDGEDGPAVPIEFINLVSENEEEGVDVMGKKRFVPPTHRALRPVRLEARERPKRGAGNFESELLSNLTEQRHGGYPDEIFVPRDLELEKGRKRLKDQDVEFLGGSKIYKGVYPPDEEEQIQVKSEPVDEAESMIVDDLSAVESDLLGQDAQVSAEAAKKGKGKQKGPWKSRGKARVKIEMPVFQTEEDIQEWQRNEEDIRLLTQELGSLLPLGKEEEDGTQMRTAVDNEGDIEMQSSTLRQQDDDPKYGRPYLFQFPPILPPLHNPATKSEPQPAAPPKEDQASTTTTIDPRLPNQQPSSSSSNTSKPHPSEAIIVDDSNKPQQQTDAKAPSSAPRFPSGKVGKLTVRKSGRMTLTWGINEPSKTTTTTISKNRSSSSSSSEQRGLTFQISRGTDAGFVQDVVLADDILVKREGQGHADGDVTVLEGQGSRRPRAIGLGAVVGKMVAIPDWESLLS
ncbi:MAG: hypothetical protein M1816_007154 [Peltula sp. TS41687]|nr:MAG: hypothetical protein M1816_007154 [Peltula sp. TS41687]